MKNLLKFFGSFPKYRLKFILLIVLGLFFPITGMSNQNYYTINSQANNEWTVGVSVGDRRTLNVTYCTGVCTSLTPIGSLITNEIKELNSSHITFTRLIDTPEESDIKFPVQTIVQPRSGLDLFGPNENSLAYGLTTNNVTFIKNYINTTPSRNISISNDQEHFLEIKENFWHETHFDDYTITIDKKTGWLISLDIIIKTFYGIVLGEVREVLIFSFNNTEAPPTQSIAFEVIIFIFSGIIITLGYISYRKNYFFPTRYSDPFKSFLSTEHATFLRKLYSKLVIGLSNNTTYLINSENQVFLNKIRNLPSNSKNSSTIITNLYPEDIKKEIASEIRGRSVLILVELGYQPLKNKYSSFISKALNVPPQTINFELKRLFELDYIKPLQNMQTLQDTRYKYYELTQKGISFLYLLKETIAYSLVIVEPQDHN